METALILKIAGIGLLVTVACQILSRAGRDEQAMLVSVAWSYNGDGAAA